MQIDFLDVTQIFTLNPFLLLQLDCLYMIHTFILNPVPSHKV